MNQPRPTSEIYVGIDVHLKSWQVTILTEHLSHKTFVQPPSADLLVNYLQKHFPGDRYHSAYEAGFSGFWVHKRLISLGVNSIVVNPADIPTTQKEHVQKEDKRDSRKIARSLRNGDLTPIHVPDNRRLEDRSLIRMRHLMVKDMRRYKQRMKSFLYFHGIFIPEEFTKSGHWSKRFIAWLDSIKMEHPTGQLSLRMLVRESLSVRSSILEVTRNMRELSRTEEYKQQFDLLCTIPGIGLINAMTILTELDDINRFESIDRLCSYVGLIPTMRSSGERERHGEMTLRGNHFLRKALIESAWVAARIDPVLNKAYNSYCKRMEPNKAIIRITRKLVSRIYFVLKNRQPYRLMMK